MRCERQGHRCADGQFWNEPDGAAIRGSARRANETQLHSHSRAGTCRGSDRAPPTLSSSSGPAYMTHTRSAARPVRCMDSARGHADEQLGRRRWACAYCRLCCPDGRRTVGRGRRDAIGARPPLYRLERVAPVLCFFDGFGVVYLWRPGHPLGGDGWRRRRRWQCQPLDYFICGPGASPQPKLRRSGQSRCPE